MAYIETEVHIDIVEYLHEVTKEELIEELKGRGVQTDDGKELKLSLIQKMNLEEFLNVFKEIPQNEFDIFVKKYKL